MDAGGPFDPIEAVRSVALARGGAGDTGGIWLVGGRVRDAILGRRSLDTDLAVAANAIELARALAAATGGSPVVLDRDRDIARVVWRGDLAEGGPPRSQGTDWRELVLDIKSLDGGTLESDLSGRDLTINALALPLSALGPTATAIDPRAVIDLHGGLGDLERGVVRVIAPSALDADPLRLLRAPRIALELGFELERATRAAVIERAARAAEPAAERVRDELLRILAVDDPLAGIDLLGELGLLAAVLPELARAAARPCRARGGPSGLDRARAVLASAVDLERGVRDGDTEITTAAEMLGLDPGRLSGHLAATSFDGRPKSLWLRVAALLTTASRCEHARYDYRHGAWRATRDPSAVARGLRATATRLRLSAAAASWLGSIGALADRPERLAAWGLAGPALARAVHRDLRRGAGHGLDIAIVAACRAWAERDVGRSRAASVPPGVGADAPEPDVATAPAVRAAIAEFFRQAQAREAQGSSPELSPEIDGRRLMAALRIEPGPTLGRIVDHLAAERAAGVPSDDAATLDVARTLLLAERATVRRSQRS